jgi:hypothetical protein
MYHMTSPRTAGTPSMQLIKTKWWLSTPSHDRVLLYAFMRSLQALNEGWTDVLFLRLGSAYQPDCSSSKRLNGFRLNVVFGVWNKIRLVNFILAHIDPTHVCRFPVQIGLMQQGGLNKLLRKSKILKLAV